MRDVVFGCIDNTMSEAGLLSSTISNSAWTCKKAGNGLHKQKTFKSINLNRNEACRSVQQLRPAAPFWRSREKLGGTRTKEGFRC